jgi:hypothetical protein
MIPTSGLFFTPKNPEELMEFCERFTGQEKAVALTVAQITMNMCAKMIEEETNEV